MTRFRRFRWKMLSVNIKRTQIIHLRSFLSALAAAVVPVGSSPTDPLRTRLNIPLGSQSKSKFVKRSYKKVTIRKFGNKEWQNIL